MTDQTKKYALLSVSDKTGIDVIARALIQYGGYELLSSGGTADVLTEAGIKVTSVAEYTGYPAMMGHKVVTLHPKVHGGILVDLRDKNDLADMVEHGIVRIDLVVGSLYPLEVAVAEEGATLESIRKETDIGGRTLLSAAAKGQCAIISDPRQYPAIIEMLKNGGIPDEVRLTMAADAEARVAQYSGVSANALSGGRWDFVIGKRRLECSYGQNKWQTAAFYSTDPNNPLSPDLFVQHKGDPVSQNNLMDLHRAIQVIKRIVAAFEVNFGNTPQVGVVVKHGNPCAAVASIQYGEANDLLAQLVLCDPKAVLGGVMVTNFSIGEHEAITLLNHKAERRRVIDVVAAPGISEDAVALLGRKDGKGRVLSNPALAEISGDSLSSEPIRIQVEGGYLLQSAFDFVPRFSDYEITGTPSLRQLRDAAIAWGVGSMSSSNVGTMVHNGQLIGNGVGQQDRVTACRLAIEKADEFNHSIRGASVYTDSFFPFSDGPKLLITAGVGLIMGTHGSIRDDEVRQVIEKSPAVLMWVDDAAARCFYH